MRPTRLTFVLAALLLAPGCDAPPAAVRSSEPPKDAVLHHAALHSWNGSAPVVSAVADTVTWYRQDARFTAQNVVATLPSKEGAVLLRAPQVGGDLSGDALDATGGVTLDAARGRAQSPTAHCANGPEGSIVSSDAGLTFVGQNQTLTARAFRFESASQHATFLGVDTQAGGAK